METLPYPLPTCERLISLLDKATARFRVVTHAPVGKCAEVAMLRGTELGQGAKALVCRVKGNGINQAVLAVLGADLQAQLAAGLGGTRASLASPLEVETLTGCVFGAIPPFSFHPDLKLVADPLLFTLYNEIAFNAGVLDRSIIVDSADYLRIAETLLFSFHRR